MNTKKTKNKMWVVLNMVSFKLKQTVLDLNLTMQWKGIGINQINLI